MEATQFYCMMAIALSGIALNQAAHWSYTGGSGPLYWHKIFPEGCSGKFQSPIDIQFAKTRYNPDLKNFAIWYDPPKQDSRMYLSNNGHTAQVDLEGDFYLSNGGLSNVYKAVQFHFHWGHKSHHGSEHLLDGKPSPIELHLVAYNRDLYSNLEQAIKKKGGLAVLGVMFKISKQDNPTMTTIVKALQHVKDPEHQKRAVLPLMSLRNFLPTDLTRYYRYNGSLTTPDCFESVVWTVFETKQTISEKQLKEFTKLLQFKNTSVTSKKVERRRRSLTKEEREKERRAEDVLDELGIKGNAFEETILISELMQERMMGDIPHVNSVISVLGPSPTPALDKGRATKMDPAMSNQNLVNSNTKMKAESHFKQGHKETQDIQRIHIQEYIVNNFRPVQPLNYRTVYRSFQLRETSVQRGGKLRSSSTTVRNIAELFTAAIAFVFFVNAFLI